MAHSETHCRAIGNAPELAQTTADAKYAGMVQIFDTVLLAQRQAPWKTFFPVGFDADVTTGTTTPTTTPGETEF